MKILGIETSCDETAAAVIQDGKKLLSSVVASSIDLHTAYGGVVPEIASRSHLEVILPVIDDALQSAKVDWDNIDALAVTQGPGLVGSLLVGVLTARTLAIARNKPLYPVNHVQAHTYACFITETLLKSYRLSKEQPKFPFLALIVSGGHTQLVFFKNHTQYKLLGQTADDAVGEAFDKVAKILGLPYPGGPSIDNLAQFGNSKAFNFPKAKMENPYNFSFSGPKTAVLRAIQQLCNVNYDFPSSRLAKRLNRAQKADIAASFQKVTIKTLVDSLQLATDEYKPASVVIAGGVAANQQLRGEASKRLYPKKIFYPDIKLCTDNAAMIATEAFYQINAGKSPADPFSLEVSPSLRV